MPTNVTPYNIPVPDGTDPVNLAGTSGDLAAMATAVGTALDGKQPVYGVLFSQKVIAGRFYGPLPTTNNNGTPTQDLLVAVPFVVPVSASFDRITVNVMTAAAGSTVRLGVYEHDVDNEQPGALAFDAGTVDSSTTGGKEITITETLAPGIYWMAHVSQGGAPQLRGQLVIASIPFPGSTFNPANANGISWAPSQSSVTGALPDPMVPSGSVNNHSRVYLRGA